jgi:hypothetical protein
MNTLMPKLDGETIVTGNAVLYVTDLTHYNKFLVYLLFEQSCFKG